MVVALLAVTAGCSFVGGPSSTAQPRTATPTATGTEPTAQPTDSPTPAGAEPTSTPETEQTGTPTDAPWEGVGVSGTGTLSVDPDRVYERVERLHGVEQPPPNVVVERFGAERELFGEPFYEAFGVAGTAEAAGVYRLGNSVYLNDEVGADEQERVLVHEFAHYLHYQSGWWPERQGDLSTDEAAAGDAVIEGSAVYATNSYAASRDDPTLNDSRDDVRAYRSRSGGLRLTISRYIAGERYVDALVDAPSELEPVLTDPPTATEGVLHPARNVSLGDLSVATEGSANWRVRDGHYESGADRRGELYLREILRLELDRATADAAANGWDNDRSLTFADSDGTGTAVAWTLRWESATEADEFAAAFDRFAERRAANASLAFASERVAPETVTVFAGNETFVDGAAATGTNESVRIAAPDANATASAETAN